MNTKYQLHEFPTVDNEHSIYFLYLLQQFISPVNELTKEITSSGKNTRSTLGIILPVLLRLVECSQSIAILLMKNRLRDASILMLNIYELRLDLIYISLDTSREEIWITSNVKSKKPWKVGAQQKEIFKEHDELSAEKSIYRNFSMTKHGNIAGDQTSFPVAFKKNNLIFSGEHPRQVTGHIFALSGFLDSALSAAFVILAGHNNKFSELEQVIHQAYTKIKESSTTNITDLLYELVFLEHPHLKEIENVRDRLRINIIPSNENEDFKIEVTLLDKFV